MDAMIESKKNEQFYKSRCSLIIVTNFPVCASLVDESMLRDEAQMCHASYRAINSCENITRRCGRYYLTDVLQAFLRLSEEAWGKFHLK